MVRRKGFSDLEYNIENIKKACTNKQVVKLFQYTSKKGIVQQQYDVLPIYCDKNFEFFRGYIVNIDGNKVTRSKNKLSRFYFERLNERVSPFKKELIFSKDLLNAIKIYQNKSPEQIDSFGWFTGTGNNLNTVDLIYGDVFEKYIIKNRKDIYKTKKYYLDKRKAIESPTSKKLNRKITITFLYVKDLLILIIGHLHDVKIECDPKDKSRLINEINGYLQSNLTFS
jgi:hypothetical protein